MDGQTIDCQQCDNLPPELYEYAARTCKLCGALECDSCLNEAGYCEPCSIKANYSKEEAIPI